MFVALQEFNQLMSQIVGCYHDLCLAMGISDSYFDILYVLCEQGDGCKQSTIYKTAAQKKTTINSSLKKMEKEGLLTLAHGDGKNTRVFLTEAGRVLSQRTAERVVQMENDIIASWSPEDRALLTAINRKYLSDFSKKVQQEAEKK